MNREVNTPNIVVDDNYKMLVNRLTRRYAERGASVYTDAEAIKQERSDARARAIAPDAYRISKTLGDNPEMYKSGENRGVRYMTTDDYLVYFSKCHDTFDAVNYYDLHRNTYKADESGSDKPRVLINRKRIEYAKKDIAARSAARTVSARSSEAKAEPVSRAKASEARTVTARTAPAVKRTAAPESLERTLILPKRGVPSKAPAQSSGNRKAFSVLAAAAASLMLIVGSVFAILPANEADYHGNLSENDIVNLAEYEGQEVLQNRE